MSYTTTFTPEIARRFKRRVFVETGTEHGWGTDIALAEGFEEVRTIEALPQLYEAAKQKYSGDSRVKLYFGSSAEHLSEMISDLKEGVTFWLDAHHWNPAEPEKMYSPLMAELEAIASHPIKNHTILIDDLRVWHDWKLNLQVIQNFILTINENYRIYRVDSRYSPQDVLVATI